MYEDTRIRRLRLVVLACASGLLCGFAGTVAAETRSLSTPQLLAHLARDHALNQRGRQTAADVLHVKTLLRAATRLDPRQAEAHIWLYELSALAGQPEEATEMLGRLVQADPGHAGGFALWLQAGLQKQQTIEQRYAWLESLLVLQRPAETQALLRAQLARLALARLDPAAARAQLEQARGLHPILPDIAALELEMVALDAPPHERLAAALGALQTNPAQVELCWQIGLLLDECGFAEQAGAFYEHALRVHQASAPQAAIPAEKMLQFAHNLVARGRPAVAIARVADVIRSGERPAEASIFLLWLLSRDDRPGEAQAIQQALVKRFARIRNARDWPVDEVAQAAWFYCRFDQQPQRALALAEAAAQRAPGDPFVTRVLGWALALNGQPERARQTLTPIARSDPYAAYQLAKMLHDGGDTSAAALVVANLETLPVAGSAFELLNQLGIPTIAARPPAERFPEIPRVLDDFDSRVLEFCSDSTSFLAAQVTLENVSPRPGEPWWAVFSLTNRASFPITLGPNRMVNPVFLVSFTVEGDRQRRYANLMAVSIDRAQVIRPGGTVRVRRALDVGPPRRICRLTPQQLQRVTLEVVLDAEQRPDGRWEPGVAGQQLRPVYFNRRPAGSDPESFHALFRALTGQSAAARYRAIEVLAELLGESQRAAAKTPRYRPAPVPAERIRRALLAALNSPSWEVRVRTLDALHAAGLDKRMVVAAEAGLAHEHWLVRLMAVRLLARQGASFAERARQIADADEDELVRDLASSYVERWDDVVPAAGGPTSKPGESDQTHAPSGEGGSGG